MEGLSGVFEVNKIPLKSRHTALSCTGRGRWWCGVGWGGGGQRVWRGQKVLRGRRGAGESVEGQWGRRGNEKVP